MLTNEAFDTLKNTTSQKVESFQKEIDALEEFQGSAENVKEVQDLLDQNKKIYNLVDAIEWIKGADIVVPNFNGQNYTLSTSSLENNDLKAAADQKYIAAHLDAIDKQKVVGELESKITKATEQLNSLEDSKEKAAALENIAILLDKEKDTIKSIHADIETIGNITNTLHPQLQQPESIAKPSQNIATDKLKNLAKESVDYGYAYLVWLKEKLARAMKNSLMQANVKIKLINKQKMQAVAYFGLAEKARSGQRGYEYNKLDAEMAFNHEIQQMYNKLYRPDLVNNKAVQTNAVVDTAKLLHAKYIADMGDKTALSSIIGDSNNRIASIAQKIIDSMQETVSQGKELGIENQIINTLAQSSHDDRSFISNKSLESCIAEAESQKREMSTHDSHLENNKNEQESLFMEH